MCMQIFIYLGIMDHLTEKEDPLAGIFLYGFKCDLDGIFHAIAKTKMTGKINLHRPEIKQGRAEIPARLTPVRRVFSFIHFLPLFFNSGNKRTPVNDRHFKAFHDAKIIGMEMEAGICPFIAFKSGMEFFESLLK